jgi:hypothetical protein
MYAWLRVPNCLQADTVAVPCIALPTGEAAARRWSRFAQDRQRPREAGETSQLDNHNFSHLQCGAPQL